jgi:hypothetical protein
VCSCDLLVKPSKAGTGAEIQYHPRRAAARHGRRHLPAAPSQRAPRSRGRRHGHPTRHAPALTGGARSFPRSTHGVARPQILVPGSSTPHGPQGRDCRGSDDSARRPSFQDAAEPPLARPPTRQLSACQSGRTRAQARRMNQSMLRRVAAPAQSRRAAPPMRGALAAPLPPSPPHRPSVLSPQLTAM